MSPRLRRRAQAAPPPAGAPAGGAYDEVAYPGAAFAQTHPDRLATIARLFGGRPADPGRCRVLELGCGDGGNLVPMAYALPGATFTGLDLSAAAIARGQEAAGELGLTNLHLDVADIGGLDPRSLGRHDYVIAHGVYSWVPPDVRRALLRVCAATLERDGVAFVSFNALPGGHLRRALGDAMRWRVRDVPDPRQRLAVARSFLDTLHARDAYAPLRAQIERLQRRDDPGLYHDDLAETSTALAISDVAADAARDGLRYLADAELHDGVEGAAADVARELDALGGDRIAREQHLDVLTLRMFRQALFVREDARAGGQITPGAVAGLRARSALRPAAKQVRLTGRSVDTFRGEGDVALRTDHPLVKAAFVVLREAWPASIAFTDLAAAATDRLGGAAAAGDDGEPALCAALAGAYAQGVAELRSWAPPVAASPGDRPVASAVARRQAAAGDHVTTLQHTTVHLEDERSRRLLTLLDGSRDQAALAETLGLGHRDADGLAARLERLAGLGLLEAPELSRSARRSAGS